MKSLIRTLLPASLVVCALLGGVSTSASAQGAHGRRIVHHTALGARVLCADGTWGYANRGGCADHDGVAVRQPTYNANINTGLTPRASARARVRANRHSAVARSVYSNTNPNRAIAKCNDGTYSHSATRRNACLSHGGVAAWL